MKNSIWRLSAAAFAAALTGTLACSGSSSGCGGTNIDSTAGSSSGAGISMNCGAGTYLVNNTCAAIPSSNTPKP